MRQSRTTKQKAILEEELATKKTFFSAEEFYVILKNKYPQIGIATVYRFLHEKVDKNFLSKNLRLQLRQWQSQLV